MLVVAVDAVQVIDSGTGAARRCSRRNIYAKVICFASISYCEGNVVNR